MDIVDEALICALTTQRSYTPLRYELGWNEPPFLTQETKEMHRQTQWLLNDMANKQPKRWLTLCGQSGCGKTHLAKAACKTVKAWGRMAQCWNMARVTQMLREGEYDLAQHLIDLPFLVLDDLGAEQTSEFIRAQIYRILDGRLEKWTIITSNSSVREIGDKLDIRIASRLHRGRNVVVEARKAHDYCLKLKEYITNQAK